MTQALEPRTYTHEESGIFDVDAYRAETLAMSKQ